MNVICDCLRKNLNGGTCDCFDNWEEDYEDGDIETEEQKEEEEIEEEDDK